MSNFNETCSMSPAHEGNQKKQHFDYMKPAVPDATGDPGKLPVKEQVTFPSGYQRSKVPSWHLLFRPFLLAMVKNMEKGEVIDGPGNPPNYLKATPAEDQFTYDHADNHLYNAKCGVNELQNLVSLACNAMVIYHTQVNRQALTEE